ncbi:Fumarate reductase/succinate dehydrogenase flavoprotein, N-terminal [Penicillium digitatum]|uniref:FAD-dependent oxidoreductase 2 FAD-binding domain-containing protein n=3 Tax=Penicillium digitatum TaxID=36651 RepID=K9FZV1_PEND2|nr:hypothetical protein PDIP_78870 [Penicillium digitatum Pd1]EKV06445.1 hypothetical protein PDIP_78870 [Penicillium digitatum Pd1]EKV08193.1 hypothetical protein PDIG_69580 [Penicillium digitatum PHI26]QQK40718.1 Fumarate reductase/succinate dehydrogenase flavoprotein, N-terminal [Penicillium digitatum]
MNLRRTPKLPEYTTTLPTSDQVTYFYKSAPLQLKISHQDFLVLLRPKADVVVTGSGNAGVDVFFDTAATALVTSGCSLGILVNRDGERFVDEGFDVRNYTCAMIGQVVFQVWDARTVEWLREEENCGKGLAAPKLKWALPIDKPPLLAVNVTTGIKFTFGGLTVNLENAPVVLETTSEEVPGLYCVGEMLGDMFSDNYHGGSGLSSGAVFRRRAGQAAVERAGKSGRLEQL